MEHEEEEEDAASQEWRALEELCHLQLRRLPSRDSLPRPQILRTSMQLNNLLVYFNARRLVSKSMAQQMAADHARVTRKTLRNWVFVFKSSAGEMLTGGQDDDDTIGCWLLESESGRKEAIAYIRQQSVSSSGEAVGKPLTVDDFHSWVNTHFIPKSLGIECHIGRTTAHTWLHALGFKYKTAKKGVFVDGHDRPDVVEFRNHSFLPKMAEVERRSFRFVPIRDEDTGAVRYEHVDGFKWGEEAGELDRSVLGSFGGCLNPGTMSMCERPVMLVVQDETIVRQYDCHKSYWGTDDMNILVKKTDGRGLMFSGFVTEEVGLPVPSDEQLQVINAKRVAQGKSKVDRHVCLKQVSGQNSQRVFTGVNAKFCSTNLKF